MLKIIEKLSDEQLPSEGFFLQNLNGYSFSTQLNIENGRFVFTMMPSLRCSLNCPHCYLTLEQRRNSAIMSLEELELSCRRVYEYFEQLKLQKINISFYWYGGEPTEMGLDYTVGALKIIDRIFGGKDEKYYTQHIFLTSLIKIPTIWFDIFNTWGRGYFQTSFDGLMRGEKYFEKWQTKLTEATQYGLEVATLSVVNSSMILDGPRKILEFLTSKGIKEASFLPFMLNENNAEKAYQKYAPSMNDYSQFMIDMLDAWLEFKDAGLAPPKIGQFEFIATNLMRDTFRNVSDQTLFLLPQGDFSLPDYDVDQKEYLRKFGNILKEDFNTILRAKERRDYLRKQVMRNSNKECQTCQFNRSCIMEFWKKNNTEDDCFGAKKLVSYINDLPVEKLTIFQNSGNVFS